MADEIRRELPRDWFTDTLVRRLATRVDDPALQADAEAEHRGPRHALLRRVRALTLTGVACCCWPWCCVAPAPFPPRPARGGGAAAAPLAGPRRRSASSSAPPSPTC